VTAIVTTAVLWALAIALGIVAWRRGDGTFGKGLRQAGSLAVFMAPRIIIGVLGAGFLAAVLPAEFITQTLGPSSGSLGIVIGAAFGMLTPAGPFVAFAIGASALESGAGLAQVVAYVTAWSVFSPQRLIIWELPLVGGRLAIDRLLVSWPLPLATGHAALLLQS
jgi:uncharacterized membrane protein YraQ (UPF0718 family)